MYEIKIKSYLDINNILWISTCNFKVLYYYVVFTEKMYFNRVVNKSVYKQTHMYCTERVKINTI